MEITIKPEELDVYVRDAILKSTVGKILKETIESHFSKSYNNPVEEAVRQMIYALVREAVADKYQEFLKKDIERILLENYTETIASKFAEESIERLLKNY